MTISTPPARVMPALLTSTEVATQLAVSTATLSRWRTFKTGPTWINLGSLKDPIPRYRQADLDAWLGAQKVVTS